MDTSEGQAPEYADKGDSQAAVSATPATGRADLEALTQEITALRAEREALRKESAAKRVKAKEEAERAGEYEKALGLLNEELAEARQTAAEVEKLREAAARLSAYEEARAAQVAARAEAIPEVIRDGLMAIPDIEKRAAAIEAYLASVGSQATRAPVAAAAAGGDLPSDDVRGLSQRDPAAWERKKASIGVPASHGSRAPWAQR